MSYPRLGGSKGQVLGGIGGRLGINRVAQFLNPALLALVQIQRACTAEGGDHFAVCFLRKLAPDKPDQGCRVVRGMRLEPSDRRADW